MRLGLLPTACILFCFLVLPHLLSTFLSPDRSQSLIWSLTALILQLLCICALVQWQRCRTSERNYASLQSIYFPAHSPARLEELALVVVSRHVRSKAELHLVGLPPILRLRVEKKLTT
jgi:hypothetical protein